MGVSIGDLITLAKAGYTPAQVKELITLSEKAEQTIPEEQQAATAPTIEATTVSAEPVKATENVEKPAEPEKEEINYKELYEKSQEDLKKAQAQNRGADASQNEPDPVTDLKSVISSFF